MKILVVLGHPDKDSFNHAIAVTATDTLRSNHHEVIFHDLYAEGFDPRLNTDEIPKDAALPPDIAQHCNEISAADGMVIIHPNWWGQPPALLKGWVDRVMRPGVAYEFNESDRGEGVPNGLLRMHITLVFTTSNTSPERERTIFGDPLETLWKNCIFGLCGVNNFQRRNFGIIVTSTPEMRRQWLKEVEGVTRKYFPG